MTHTDAGYLTPETLQAAVDAIAVGQVLGAPQGNTIIGVDIIPGIVVNHEHGRLEAPAVVYFEAGSSGRSRSQRATITFHITDQQVVVERVVLA